MAEKEKMVNVFHLPFNLQKDLSQAILIFSYADSSEVFFSFYE